MKVEYKYSALASALLALSACGGGGGGDAGPASTQPTPTTASAEGVYGGTLSGNTGASAFDLIVLDDGTYWALYGSTAANALVVSGFVQGHGTSNSGSFTGDAKDFGVVPALGGTVSAQYTVSPSINGSITTGARAVTFTGGAVPNSTYVYAKPAALGDIAGSWTLQLSEGETLPITVTGTGAITGVASGGCHITATATPRASGKNIFDISLTYGPVPCSLNGQVSTGIAIVYPLSTGGSQLGLAVVDSTRSFGLVGVATR